MAGLGIALIGAAGSIGGGLLSGSGGKKPGMSRADKRFLAAQELEGAKATLRGELGSTAAQRQISAAESARSGLLFGLGDIGTYEESYEDYTDRTRAGTTGLLGGTAGAGYGEGLFRDFEEKDKVKGTFQYVSDISEGGPVAKKSVGRDFSVSVKGKELNVPEYLRQATDSRTYRMMSRLTAEADQLIREEGPLWNKINASITGSIYQSAGAAGREALKQIQDNLARGGAAGLTARRAGMAAVMQMNAQIDINRQRTEALWQSSLAVKQWARDNARNQAMTNQQWVAGLGGIRDGFNTMMQNAILVHTSNIPSTAVNAANAQLDGYTKIKNINAQATTQKSGIGSIVAGLSTNIFGYGMNELFKNNKTNNKTADKPTGWNVRR